MKKVHIEKGTVGPNTLGSEDSTSGLLLTGLPVAGTFELGKVYPLFNLQDAGKLGIDENYDKTNNVRVFHHIGEFYRMAGKGKKLFIMAAPQETTMVSLIENERFAKKLIIEAAGEIRRLGIAINPKADYNPTMVDGLEEDIRNSIAKAQALAEWTAETSRPINICLEGRGYSGDSAGTLELDKIPNTKAPKVTLIIGQDWKFADTLDDIGKKYACVGTALGCKAFLQVHENIGEIERMNLTDAGKDKFMIGGLSSHQKIADVESDLETLDTKRYVFVYNEPGTDGLRFNNDYTCVEQIVDDEGNINENTWSSGETIDKASRLLRIALAPKIRTKQDTDSKTGLLPLGVIKYFEGIGNRVFNRMQNAGEISEGKTIIDPTSNLLTGDKALKVSFSIVEKGTLNEIRGTINLKTSIS